MWPIDAALAGTDSLVLLDEAHLANGLRHLIGRVNNIQSAASERITNRPVSIVPVAITATADPDDASIVFDIDDIDEQHPEVSRRLNAPKRLSLYAGKSWDIKPTGDASNQHEPSADDSANLRHVDIAKDVVAATKALLKQLDADTAPAGAACRPWTVLVFVNSPRTATQVHQGLEALPDCETRVLTGMTRGHEAAEITKDVRAWMAPGRTGRRSGDAATRIVVATQTLEVGANLDADHMVTESCGVQSLVQRLGRLNRMGNRDDSRVCYVHDPASKERPLYGTAPAEIWERFKQFSQPDGSTRKGIEHTTLDLSPAALRDPACAALPPAPRPAGSLDYAVLHDAALRDLAQTSCPSHQPPAEVFFEATQEPNREVDLAWRAYVPDSRHQRDDGQRERLWPPLSAEEVVSVPVWAARNALQDLPVPDRERLLRVEPDRTMSRVAWRDDEPVVAPGQTLILPASAGMLSEHGMLEPGHRAMIVDAAVARAESGLPLDKEAIVRLCGYSAPQQLPPAVAAALADLDILFEPDGLDDHTEGDIDERVEALVEALHELVSADEGTAASTPSPAAFRERQNLAASVRGLLHEDGTKNWTRESPSVGAPRIVPNAQKRVHAWDRLDEHDDHSVGLPANETLTQHSSRTAAMAHRTASRLGMEPGLEDLVRLAAISHDAGKADARFQRWLGEGERPSEVLGKSATPRHEWPTYRRRSGWPRGGRHEELSCRLVKQYLQACPRNDGLDDLMLHLVLSHHGHGRPLLLGVANDKHPGVPVKWSIDGVDCQADAALSATDWDQPSRFHALCDAWGYWGLALMEAVLRQSDHAVS